jgi:maltose-binding protein MalE
MTKFFLIASVTVGLLFILTSCTATPDSNHSMTDGSNMSGTTHTE